jgi:hypothetical protein
MSLAEYFSTGPPFERRIYDAVAAHLHSLGPVQVEYVSVGILFRRSRTFAELRPMRKKVRMSVLLLRRLQHPRIVKSAHGPGLRSGYFVDLSDAHDVDAEVRDWLTEAYFAASA